MNHESLSGRGEQLAAARLHQLRDVYAKDPAFQPYPDAEYCGNDPELDRDKNEFYQAREESIAQLEAEIKDIEAKIAEN